MSDDEVLALSPSATFHAMGDGAVILLGDSGQLYSCNETSESFLRQVDGARSLADIVNVLAEEYDVDRNTLLTDLSALADSLQQEGIVVSRKK